MRGTYRLGLDIGGTFTDLFLMNESSGEYNILKTPSTLVPVEAVCDGIAEIKARFAVQPEDIVYFSHGTTIAVNTLLQRTGAHVGVLITQGFRDILELRRLRLPKANDFFVPRPQSLVPRRHVREIRERILANGAIRCPISMDEVIEAAGELRRQGIESLAICFLHSYRNPSHEELAKVWVEEAFPDLYVCTSSEIWPQQREYERALISVINAHVGKRMRAYFNTLEAHLKREGLRCRIFTTKSNGGVMSAAMAADRPVETLLSGPASGVIGAAYIGRTCGESCLITLDMGGTSVDISILQHVQKGEIPYSTESTVGDFPVIMPTVDVSSIGAGGGSIAWIDAEGILKVGPHSAGADPGPACYGRGGNQPTITDAYLVSGILHPKRFLGGEMKLDADLSFRAIGTLGERLGLDAYHTADAILQIATSRIYAELLPQLARRGVDSHDCSVIAYGGAGPTHVFLLARDLPLKRILIPPTPGALCALGCLAADMRADFVISVWKNADEITVNELQQHYLHLAAEARKWLEEEEVDLNEVFLLRVADMCYVGQSFELQVPLPCDDIAELNIDILSQAFYDRYERVYGLADRGAPVRLLECRTQIVGVTPKPTFRAIRTQKHQKLDPSKRLVFLAGKWDEVDVHERSALRSDDRFSGPLIIEQYDTTTFVPRGFQVLIDRWGNIVGEAMDSQAKALPAE